MKLIYIPTLAGLAALVSAADPPSFDWTSITPSSDLEFHPCYDDRFCARLLVPLDWKNTSNPARATLAVAKIPASVPYDDATFGGPLIIQNGGPGSPGTELFLDSGDELHSVVDTPGKRHFELIFFDARGVGYTEPAMDCYPGNPQARTAAALNALAAGPHSSGLSALAYAVSSAKALGQRCLEIKGDVMPYVNTASVARDMLEIVDKLHELRLKESKSKRGYVEARNATNTTELPRLQYMSFSYGTVIGHYFASLFPGRVGRMLLDGVVDPVDYSSGPGYLDSTVDNDKVVDGFFQGCFKAGTETCKLFHDGDKSPQDISKRLWTWVDSLDTNPIITKWGADGDSLVFRSGDVRSTIASDMAFPTRTFQPLASMLEAAMGGNSTALGQRLTDNANLHNTFISQCGRGSAAIAGEAEAAILCTDGDDVSGKDLHYWHGYVQDQLRVSRVAGDSWSSVRMACAGWTVRANWQFKGPFTSPSPSRDPSKPEQGRPAAPILYLANRLDPRTPLRAAEAMVKSHPGAGLLIEESMGHTVLDSDGPTACNVVVIREYLDTGKVPPKGTTCPGIDPWQPAAGMKRRRFL